MNKKFKYSKINLISEPISKNTAPAIAVAAYYIKNKLKDITEDPIIITTPSDHIIKSKDIFNNALNEAINLANQGYITTFGIKPSKPDTGYGYIKTTEDPNLSNIAISALKVEEFKEKPDFRTACLYCDSKKYYWNSGIFIFKASTILNEINKYCEKITTNLENIGISEDENTGIARISYDDYEDMPNISIDYAVMEHSDLISLIPLDCDWNDLGSWEAIYDISEKDERNNSLNGNIIDIDSENSLIYGTSKLIASIGLKDIVLVETEDAILACAKDKTQDVKKIFEMLKEHNKSECLEHKTVYRPWGYYTVLQAASGFKIKIIVVSPKAKLSLQMHYHRSESWIIFSGIAKVIKDNMEYYLKPGESVNIPQTVKHSLENPGKIDLKIIEIQFGDYLEEDDITRFEDKYGRAKEGYLAN